jgi:hypothetical protein
MKTFAITFTQEQLQVLNAALSEIPYRVAAPLINSINAQIQKQFDRDENAVSGSNNNIPRSDDSPNNL